MITIRDLHKSFGSLEVAKNLNLHLNEGETLVILGRSGVGKSVLLRHIMGLLPPDSGEILIKGEAVHFSEQGAIHPPVSMGMLFQSGALFDSMNIEENVSFYLTHHKSNARYSKAEVKELVRESLKQVGLEGTEKKMPSELSGGMRKRAALARLIIYRPKVLLYDEPTSGLDPMTALQIGELIQQIQQELGATSVVVSHDLPMALRISSKVAFFEDKHLPYQLPPEDFVRVQHPTLQAFLKNASLPLNLQVNKES